MHAALIGLLVLSIGWNGIWLPMDEAKSGDQSPLKGFTVVLAPSDASQYMPQSESMQAEEAQRALQSVEAEASSLKPEINPEGASKPEDGLGAETQRKELLESAHSATTDALERIVAGSPDAQKAEGEESDLLNRYYTAFRNNLALRWQGPPVSIKAECRLLVSQLEQGQLVDVVFLDCPLPADARQQIVQALDKAVALPYAGYEQVISHSMEVVVCFPEVVGC